MSAVKIVGVTGVTGLLGRAWIEYVLKTDPDLRVLALMRPGLAAAPARLLETMSRPLRGRIELVAADFSNLQFSAQTLERLAKVDRGWWHFAAVTSLVTSPEAEALAMAVNAQGTARLVAAVREVTPRAPFFHVSTAYVAGRRTGRIMEAPADPSGAFHNPYEHSKALAESYVQGFFAAGGRGAIYRPSLVLNTEAGENADQVPDVFAHAILSALKRGETEFYLRVSPEARLHLISLPFALRAFAAISARPDAPPRIYHLTPAREMRFAELRLAIERAVPLNVKLVPDASRGDLPDASRAFDRMLDEIRDYFTDEVVFDRTNTEAVLPASMAGDTCNLPELVARRLGSGNVSATSPIPATT